MNDIKASYEQIVEAMIALIAKLDSLCTLNTKVLSIKKNSILHEQFYFEKKKFLFFSKAQATFSKSQTTEGSRNPKWQSHPKEANPSSKKVRSDRDTPEENVMVEDSEGEQANVSEDWANVDE